MKRLIYQVYIGERNNLYDFCTKSVKKYSEKHGIDYILQDIPLLKIKPDPLTSERNPSGLKRSGGFLPIFEKENAFLYLEEYDQIAIIDADIYCHPKSPNIFEDLSEEYDFGAVVEREMPITNSHKRKISGYSRGQYSNLQDVDWKWNESGAEFMNMGLMVLNQSIKKYLKGQSPEEFIHRPEFKNFIDGKGDYKWSTDQTLLNYWIRKEKMSIKKMDWRWNAMYNAVSSNRLPEAYFIHFFLRKHLPQRGENVEYILRNIYDSM